MNAMAVGRIEFAPYFPERGHRYDGTAVAAGDITVVGPARVPPAANDNHVGPRLIGLMGFAGAGKTTVANILRRQYGFVGPHIKEPIVMMARELLASFGIRPTMISRYLDGDLKREVIPEIGISGTEIQQQLGSWGRGVRDDLWLSRWKNAALSIIVKGGGVVQESVRHLNEADAVRSLGGIIIEVRRPGVGPLNTHESESIPVDPDLTINNDGSVSDLTGAVAAVLSA